MLVNPAREASAHAYLDRSEPAADSVVATAPAEAQLWFTEPLESQYTSAELYDVEGQKIETGPSEVSADDTHLLILPLPGDLPDGTYTIAWRNVSAADGHPAEGFFSFTTGTADNLQLPAPPATVDFGGPPTAVAAIGNWLTLLGIMGVLGLLVTFSWVVGGSSAEAEIGQWSRVWRIIRWLIIVGVGVAVAGSLVDLIDQTLTVTSSLSLTNVSDLIRTSNFGQLWLARVAGLGIVLLGTILLTRAEKIPQPFDRRLLTFFALLPIAAFALNSHAAAIGEGRLAAIVADFAHIVGGGVWIGGLIAIGALLISLRKVGSDDRRSALADALPRFSTLFIASVIIIVVSGIYASWLQVGNLTALTETDYGKLLVLKVLLVLVMAALGAYNLLRVEPRLRQQSSRVQHLRRTVRTEVAIGVIVLLITGLLISLPTARGEIAASSGRISETFSEDGAKAMLTISPGAVGANRFTVDVRGIDLPDDTVLLMRIESEDQSLGGLQEISLERDGERRFESVGSQLSVAGEWDIELIIRRPDTADWRASSTIELGTEPPSSNVPAEAPRFDGVLGAISSILFFLAIPALIICVRMAKRQTLVMAGLQLMFVSLAGLLISLVI